MKEVSSCGAEEKQLSTYIEEKRSAVVEGCKTGQLHEVKLIPGEMTLLSTSFRIAPSQRKGMKFSVSGRDAKVLVMLNGRMLGRLWLPSEQVRPIFKGGNELLLYLPKSFLKEENDLDLLVEAMKGDPELTEMYFEEV